MKRYVSTYEQPGWSGSLRLDLCEPDSAEIINWYFDEWMYAGGYSPSVRRAWIHPPGVLAFSACHSMPVFIVICVFFGLRDPAYMHCRFSLDFSKRGNVTRIFYPQLGWFGMLWWQLIACFSRSQCCVHSVYLEKEK